MERPQLVIENGVPTHLFFVGGKLTRVAEDGCYTMTDSWNMVISLRAPR